MLIPCAFLFGDLKRAMERSRIVALPSICPLEPMRHDDKEHRWQHVAFLILYLPLMAIVLVLRQDSTKRHDS
jgi:hypothetical protein